MTKTDATPKDTTVKPKGVLKDLDTEAAAGGIKGGKKKELPSKPLEDRDRIDDHEIQSL